MGFGEIGERVKGIIGRISSPRSTADNAAQVRERLEKLRKLRGAVLPQGRIADFRKPKFTEPKLNQTSTARDDPIAQEIARLEAEAKDIKHYMGSPDNTGSGIIKDRGLLVQIEAKMAELRSGQGSAQVASQPKSHQHEPVEVK